MKLSIIVPIYNVEPYLRRCIDSILAQTFTDFELILVDDGSPDNCPAICDEYAKKDPRIVVIHKENGGLSDARNAGLNIAKGDYIGFVDSDDLIHPQMYEHMIYRIIESNSDFAACGMKYIDNDENQFGCWPPESQDVVFSRNDFIEHFYPDVRRAIMQSVCNKLFCSKLFRELRFPKGKTYEDGMIQLDLYDQCSSIVVLKEYYYYYFCVREESIINSSYSKKQFDSIELSLKQYKYFEKLEIQEQQHYTLSVYVNNYLSNWFAVKFKAKELSNEFLSYTREFNEYYSRIYTNPQICRLKKLTVLIHRALPQIAYKICRKYFPECLHDSMK